MTATMACLCLAGCKSKDSQNSADTQSSTDATEQAQAEASAEVSADLADNYMLCPFMLQVDGQTDADGNPVTVERKWICGSSVGASTIADWVLYTADPRFAFNVDGWHFVGKDIVNAAETYKIVDDDAVMSLSSYCDVHTEKYVKPAQVEDYDHVAFSHLYPLADEVMEAPMLKTSGNRHDNAAIEEYLADKELREQVMSSFYLQEWVNVELPAELAKQGVTLAVLPYQLSYEGIAFDADKLATCLWSGKPEMDDATGHATASFYVAEIQPVGLYDLLIIKGDKPQHRLTMVMTAEKKG